MIQGTQAEPQPQPQPVEGGADVAYNRSAHLRNVALAHGWWNELASSLDLNRAHAFITLGWDAGPNGGQPGDFIRPYGWS